MKTKFVLILILCLLSINFVLAAAPEQTNCDCSSATNTIKTDLIIINQTLNNALENLSFYQNQTEIYKTLYEDMNVSVSNRELINIYNTINILNANITQIGTKIDKLENKMTIFSIEVGVSIISLSLIGATLIEIVIRWRRRRQRESNS